MPAMRAISRRASLVERSPAARVEMIKPLAALSIVSDKIRMFRFNMARSNLTDAQRAGGTQCL
jgi:hypothetical protein